MKRQNKDPASGAQLCEKRPGFSVTGRLSFMTASPSWPATFFSPLGLRVRLGALSGATRMGTPRTKPLIRSCDPAPPGLLWRPDLRRPFFCPPGSVFPSHCEAQPLCSALRPLPSPPPTPTQARAGIRDLFYLQSLKKPVAKVTEAGTAGSLPWGEGLCP